MKTRKKAQKHCDGCQRDQGARFRTLADLFLCEDCYRHWLDGETPEVAVPTGDGEGGRW